MVEASVGVAICVLGAVVMVGVALRVLLGSGDGLVVKVGIGATVGDGAKVSVGLAVSVGTGVGKGVAVGSRGTLGGTRRGS